MLGKIYEFMPVFLQNLLVTLYGFHLRRTRFGKEYKKTLKNIDLNKDIEQNSSQIIDYLIYAKTSVPFYRNFFCESTNFENHEVAKKIDAFPIISKADLRGNAEEMISDNFNEKILTISTSGSTGSPLEVKMDAASREVNYAFFHKFLESIGLDEFERSATFAGRILVPMKQRGVPYWRANRAMNTLLLSSYHLSRETCMDYIKAIEKWAPHYIDSYPSAIYELSTFLIEKDYKPRAKIKAIITSSETLFDYQRLAIEKVFDCPVYDYYGCAEQSVLAFQTPDTKGEYLIPAQYCLLEVLDEQLLPVPIGQAGKIVCTNIFNKASPIIRYDIGDSAIVSEYYPGGRFAKKLKVIEGRADDIILTPEGNRVGRLDPVLKGMDGVKETQIIQKSLDTLFVKVVLLEDKSIDETRFIENLRLRVGLNMKIVINYVDSIPRTKSGKFRAVISEV